MRAKRLLPADQAANGFSLAACHFLLACPARVRHNIEKNIPDRTATSRLKAGVGRADGRGRNQATCLRPCERLRDDRDGRPGILRKQNLHGETWYESHTSQSSYSGCRHTDRSQWAGVCAGKHKDQASRARQLTRCRADEAASSFAAEDSADRGGQGSGAATDASSCGDVTRQV
jgi:hypothetical protein